MKLFASKDVHFITAVFLFAFASNLFSAEEKPSYRQIEPGVEYMNQRMTNGPESIYVIKISRKQKDLKLVTTLGKGTVYGLASLIEQTESIPQKTGRAVAGINGDFFLLAKKPYQGDPRSLQIVDGELVSAPSGEVCFWLDGKKPKMEKVVSKMKVTWPDGTETPIGLNEDRDENKTVLLTPRLGESTRTTNGVELVLERAGWNWLPLRVGKSYNARVREIAGTNTILSPDILVLSLGPKTQHPDLKKGMRLKISTATVPDLSKVETAIGGAPMLVHKGKTLFRAAGTNSTVRVQQRNPRTAFGWDDSSFYFVVVDGRRKEVSMGMDFSELAEEMASLGCKEAMNFDGGGSSTIWSNGKVLNQPSDNRNRSVANALICVRRSK
jgi:hypothetical protein